MLSRRRVVEQWIARLDEVDLNETEALEAILNQIPSKQLPRIAKTGGSAIREKLLAPVFAQLEREGRIEWTGQFDPTSGQKIWRSHLRTRI
jgi:hypothetical protein